METIPSYVGSVLARCSPRRDEQRGEDVQDAIRAEVTCHGREDAAPPVEPAEHDSRQAVQDDGAHDEDRRERRRRGHGQVAEPDEERGRDVGRPHHGWTRLSVGVGDFRPEPDQKRHQAQAEEDLVINATVQRSEQALPHCWHPFVHNYFAWRMKRPLLSRPVTEVTVCRTPCATDATRAG
jgi:hypothetical protein